MSWSRHHEMQARAVVNGEVDATAAQLRALLGAALEELDRVRGTVMEKRARQKEMWK